MNIDIQKVRSYGALKIEPKASELENENNTKD